MQRMPRPSGRTSSTPTSASVTCPKADGRGQSNTSGPRVHQETLCKTAPMRKSAPLSKASNSIGADGGNRREPSLRSTPVSCGRSKWLRQPWSTQVTATKAGRSTAAVLAWSLPTPSAVKTATNPTSVFGQNTTVPWPSKQALPPPRATLLWTPWSKALRKSPRTPCRVSLPTSCQAASPTCSICRGPTMPWTPHVRPRSRPCSMPAVCCTRAKSTR